MQFDWTTLGATAPTALVNARNLAHHAVQWVARAARANLEPLPDDSHSSLEWSARHGALLSEPLPAQEAQLQVGLKIATLELIVLRAGVIFDTFSLQSRRDAMTGVWFDSALRALSLNPASETPLPYSIPHHPVAKGAAYIVSGKGDALEELARWFAAAADLLDDFVAGLDATQPGATPLRCWPHHFDIATLVRLEEGDAGTARSVGVGMSPGDGAYAQPYLYLSPWPRPAIDTLPQVAPPGQWHTQDFVSAIATGSDLLALPERGEDALRFVRETFEVCRARLAD